MQGLARGLSQASAATQAEHQADVAAPAPGSMRRAGSAGHLEKIRLENFMCHENFELSFG